MTDPNIYIVDNIFSATELEKLLCQMHELPLNDAMVGNGGVARVDYKFRVSKHSKLPEENSEYKWIFDRINQQVDPLNQQQWKFPLQPELTDIEYNEYEAENGSHFEWHTDKHDSGLRSTRRLSIIIQLSHPEKYAGGELQMRTDSGETLVFSTTRGATIVFTGDVEHRVTALTKGKRKSLIAWLSIDEPTVGASLR